MAKDIFISYSSKDEKEVREIKKNLERNDITCWIAPDDIPFGSNYAKWIPSAIRSCQVFLLILTENAQKSQHVQSELDFAFNQKKIIIPYMLTETKITDEFIYYLSNIQILKAYENKKNANKELISRIKKITSNINQNIKPTENDVTFEQIDEVTESESSVIPIEPIETIDTPQTQPAPSENRVTPDEQNSDSWIDKVLKAPEKKCPYCGSLKVKKSKNKFDILFDILIERESKKEISDTKREIIFCVVIGFGLTFLLACGISLKNRIFDFWSNLSFTLLLGSITTCILLGIKISYIAIIEKIEANKEKKQTYRCLECKKLFASQNKKKGESYK